jgi:hypothetical protein
MPRRSLAAIDARRRSGWYCEAPIARTLPAFTSRASASSVSSTGVSGSSLCVW